MSLSDGIELLQPAGATFVQDVGIVNEGAIVADKWVMIANPNYNQEPYVVYTDNDISFGVTLTFRYDNLRKVLATTSAPSGESLYDLSGRKLQKISRPGLYINNGKKIVVK